MMIVVFDPGGILLYKRLMETCRWMGSHFPELLEWGRKFFGFFGVGKFFIFTVSKRTRMFVL